MNLMVLGASGGCGRWLVRLAAERGHDVTAVVRPSTAFDAPPGVNVHRGEVLDEGGIDGVMCGHEGVLSALGLRRRAPMNPWSRLTSPPDLTTRAATTITAAMRQHGVERIVAISAAGVADSITALPVPMRWMIAASRVGIAYRDLAGMERVFGGSGLDWMVVRPVTLVNGPVTDRAAIVERYGLTAKIARAEVATWMLDAIERPGPFSDRKQMIGRV